LAAINPFLITIFDESYLRFIAKNTTFYLDGHHVGDINFIDQLEAEADEAYIAFANEEDPDLASDLLIHYQNLVHTINTITGINNNNEEILGIGNNIPNLHNEEDVNQDTSDDETETLTSQTEEDEFLNYFSAISGLSVEQISNQLLAENPGFNPNEITETSSRNNLRK
jgi:hypothetical protein